MFNEIYGLGEAYAGEYEEFMQDLAFLEGEDILDMGECSEDGEYPFEDDDEQDEFDGILDQLEDDEFGRMCIEDAHLESAYEARFEDALVGYQPDWGEY